MPDSSTLIAALGRAIEGQRVCFFATSQAKARDYFLEAPSDLQGATYRRTYGAESITFHGGGVIHFRSARYGRGFVADRAYVPATISDDVLADIVPCLASSRDGAIVAYETEASAAVS